MIFRIALATLFVVLALYVIRRLRRGKLSKTQQPLDYEETVTCETCGLRLPKKEAIAQDGHYYCCREHAED